MPQSIAPTAPIYARPGLIGGLALIVAALLGCTNDTISEAERAALQDIGDPKRGKRVLEQYACVTCHKVPGVVGADVWVGPPLDGFAHRKYIAGVLPNTPDNLIRWLISPPSVDPLTAMPDMHLKEDHARDLAAYLYTLD